MLDVSGLGGDLLANGLLVIIWSVYQAFRRCTTSRCRYTSRDGLTFDLDEPGDCPGNDMDKIADLLKQRAELHRKGTYRPASPPPGPPPNPPGSAV